MNAELGSTDDPRALVPGDPAAVAADARALADRAAAVARTGEALRRIGTGAWTGPASDAWREHHDEDAVRWFQHDRRDRCRRLAGEAIPHRRRWVMGETGSYEETIDYLRRYAAQDWLELSVVVDWANSVTGPGSAPDRIADMTLRLADDLVAGGAVPGDLVADGRDFVPWAGDAADQLSRLRTELSDMVAQGRLPEGIDICWFHKIDA